MIKFSDETIRDAWNIYAKSKTYEHWMINVAAVFEVAANAQVEGLKARDELQDLGQQIDAEIAASVPNTYECVIADLTQQVRDANARAERVVAAIERAIPVIKAKLEGAHPGSTICLARDIAEALGLTITPARELTVTWNKEN